MGLWDKVKGVTQHLPGIRNPERYSLVDLFYDEYGWALTAADKNIGDLDTYHQAFDKNVWVRRCCMVICDEILSTGFKINNPNKATVNYERVNYLTDLFNAPEGKYAEATLIKPNKKELGILSGMSVRTNDEIKQACRKLCEKCRNDYLFSTGRKDR